MAAHTIEVMQLGIFSFFIPKGRKKSIQDGKNITGSRSRLRYSWLPRWLHGDYALHNSELLFAAVSRISNALSAMPIQLYKKAVPINSDLNDMLGFEPNPNMTSTQFIKTLESCRCATGNGYALKLYGADGTLERIDVLDPHRVTPVLEEGSGELWYRVRPERGNEYVIHNFYIIHVMFLSTNGCSGISPVAVLRDTLAYSEGIEAFSKEQLEKGVNASVILEAPATLGDNQVTSMINKFTDTYHRTSGNVMVLESGVTARQLNLSPVDTKLLEVEKITRSKVAMVYNIPPHLLGDYSGATSRSQEQIMLEFLQLTMLPIITAYEQEFNRKLLSKEQRKEGYRFKINMDAVLRADAKTQAEVDFRAIRSAIRTPDEIRADHALPPLPSGLGKHAMISQDLSTLSYTVQTKPKVQALPLERADAKQRGGSAE